MPVQLPDKFDVLIFIAFLKFVLKMRGTFVGEALNDFLVKQDLRVKIFFFIRHIGNITYKRGISSDLIDHINNFFLIF